MNKSTGFKVRAISICTVIILMYISIFSYSLYNDSQIYINYQRQLEGSFMEQMTHTTHLMFNENTKKVEIYYKNKVIEIYDDILASYETDDELKYDIDNPSTNSKLSNILDNNLIGTWFNSENSNNRALVISDDHILWNRFLPFKYTSDSDPVTIEQFIKHHHHKDASIKAFNNILSGNNNTNYIIWEVRKNDIDAGTVLTDLTINNILHGYAEHGLSYFKSIELLVPIYITDDGDIFGKEDSSSLGHVEKNYKMVIIQRLSIYDMFYNEIYNIEQVNKEFENLFIENGKNLEMKQYQIVFTIIFMVLILLSSAYIQKRYTS